MIIYYKLKINLLGGATNKMDTEVCITLKSVGNRIKIQREYMGYSREKLAELIGISSRTVAYLENGQKEMGIKTAINICQILDLSPEYLLFSKESWDTDDISTLLKNCPPSKLEYIKIIIKACLKI